MKHLRISYFRSSKVLGGIILLSLLLRLTTLSTSHITTTINLVAIGDGAVPGVLNNPGLLHIAHRQENGIENILCQVNWRVTKDLNFLRKGCNFTPSSDV